LRSVAGAVEKTEEDEWLAAPIGLKFVSGKMMFGREVFANLAIFILFSSPFFFLGENGVRV